MSVYYENNRSELVKDASTCIAVPKKNCEILVVRVD